jgi:hypothetical protein
MNNNNKIRDIKWYRNRVKTLRAKPQYPQRSVDWFRARNTRITASEVACCLPKAEDVCKLYVDLFNIPKFKYDPNKCLSHYDTQEKYIIGKAAALHNEIGNEMCEKCNIQKYKDSIYTLHGKKFEEIATRLYRKYFNTDVIEFGLLPHSRLSWLAASPDGITPNGIMLEIKCPYSRKIDGIPPIWYYTQMIQQLEVADLDECHFLECEITELENETIFINQPIVKINETYTYKYIDTDIFQDKGILLNKVNEELNSETKYIYPPDYLNTVEEFINWKNQIIDNSLEPIEPIYYFVHKWNVVKIFRQKEWFSFIAKKYIKPVFDKIYKLQNNKELFINYCESYLLIQNKDFIEKYNNTTCQIHTHFDEEFVFYKENNDNNELIYIDEKGNTVNHCLIDDD